MNQPRDYNRDVKRIEANKKLCNFIVQEYLANKNLELNKVPNAQFSDIQELDGQFVDSQVVDNLAIDNRGANQGLNIENKEMGQVNIDPTIKSIICGTILGDSSIAIQTNYKEARVQYRHSSRQLEWFLWKTVVAFKDFANPSAIQLQAPDGNQEKATRNPGELLGKFKIHTKVDPRLTAIHRIIVKGGNKTISRSWLNHMNSWFLATLWCDDGSLVGGTLKSPGGREGVICLNGLTLVDAQVLAQYIKVVWGVDCYAVDVESKRTKSNPESPQIHIADLDNLEKFLRIIAPLIPVKSMLYKVCLCPLDEGRLQRWASEVENLVLPEFKQEVQKIYAYYTICRKNTKAKVDWTLNFYE
jgi:hypothetical protein